MHAAARHNVLWGLGEQQCAAELLGNMLTAASCTDDGSLMQAVSFVSEPTDPQVPALPLPAPRMTDSMHTARCQISGTG